MERLKILVTMPQTEIFNTFFNPSLLQRLALIGEVQLNETGAQYTQAALAQLIRGVHVCVCGWGSPVFSQEVLANADKLRLIAHTGGSVKPYVTDDVYEKGIRVLSGNEVFAQSVGESVIAYALASLRAIPFYANDMKNGGWPQSFYNKGLLGRSVGVVGYGMIARYAVGMLKPFHCPIKVFSRHISNEELTLQNMQKAQLEEIFSSCDIISLHCGMTAENHHLITETLLRSMKPGALLINTARGAVIDEASLCRVLAERTDLSAVLDVFETEPLPSAHPLRGLPNVLLMPHMAGPTVDRRFAVTQSVITDIESFLAGKEMSCEISRSYAAKMSAF